MLTILKLKVGDHVRTAAGVSGTVVAFRRDHALVIWDGNDDAVRVTDEDLRTVRRVSPFEAEDTIPG